MREGNAGEFSAIRSYPHVTTKHLPDKRVHDVQLFYCGAMVGWETIVLNQHKPDNKTFLIDEEMLAKATAIRD